MPGSKLQLVRKINRRDDITDAIKNINNHFSKAGDNNHHSLTYLFVRKNGNTIIIPNPGNNDKYQKTSHEKSPINPIGIAKRIPDVMIDNKGCLMRYDERFAIIPFIFDFHINETIYIATKTVMPKARQYA